MGFQSVKQTFTKIFNYKPGFIFFTFNHTKKDIEVMDKFCMMEVFHIVKPLKGSCFSEQQIVTLFNLWKEFMFQKFRQADNGSDQKVRAEIDNMYPNASTTKSKYDTLRLTKGVNGTPPLAAHEKEWVMSNESPTSFVRFLRTKPEIIDNLRMCFKPLLLHNYDLRTADFMAILIRYQFWFAQNEDKRLNILGIEDIYGTADEQAAPNGATITTMIQNLENNWINARFHVAILNTDKSWRVVLIDRRQRTFEYYDPKGRDLDLTRTDDMMSTQVMRLLQAAQSLDNSIITRTSEKIKRGITKRSECGMYILLFLQARIVEAKSYEYFIEYGIPDTKCKKLRSYFFDVRKVKAKSASYRAAMAPNSYDVRLAVLDMLRYIDYLVNISSAAHFRERREDLRKTKDIFIKEALGPASAKYLNQQGQVIQSKVLGLMPSEFISYAGANVWFNIVQDVVGDPYTVFLKELKSGKKRAHSTKRVAIADQLFISLMAWTRSAGADPRIVHDIKAYAKMALSHFYIPLILFNPDNARFFTLNMSPDAFIRNCMTKKERVGFGVHFIRDLVTYMKHKHKLNITTVLDEPQFQLKTKLVKPISAQNLQGIKTNINRCQEAMRQARQLLQQTSIMQMTGVGLRGRTLSETPVGKRANPTIHPMTRPLQQPDSDQMKLDQIVLFNQNDLRTSRILQNDQVKPWNFPLNVPDLEQVYPTFNVPPEYRTTSLTKVDLKRLLTMESFLLFYGVNILLVVHFIGQGRLTDTTSMRLIIMSLIQLYNQTDAHSVQQKAMCTYISMVYKVLNARPNPGLGDLVSYLRRFHQACGNQSDTNSPFMNKVYMQYETLMS